MVKRQAVEAIEHQKRLMVAALYSNPNWDDEDNDRPGKLKAIEAAYDHAIQLIYDPDLDKRNQPEIDWNHPFYKAALRAHGKELALEEGEREQSSMGQVIEMDPDQQRARERSRQSIDQVS